jgi:hypothetical protein
LNRHDAKAPKGFQPEYLWRIPWQGDDPPNKAAVATADADLQTGF